MFETRVANLRFTLNGEGRFTKAEVRQSRQEGQAYSAKPHLEHRKMMKKKMHFAALGVGNRRSELEFSLKGRKWALVFVLLHSEEA